MTEAELRQRVERERKRRGYFSGRAAAQAAKENGAKISYTTWNDWESGARPLGDAMRFAVMALFGWPSDWPDNPPPDVPEGSPPTFIERYAAMRPGSEFTEEVRDALRRERPQTFEEFVYIWEQTSPPAAEIRQVREQLNRRDADVGRLERRVDALTQAVEELLVGGRSDVAALLAAIRAADSPGEAQPSAG